MAGCIHPYTREHLSEVERKLADLTALRRELTALLGQCRHGIVAECRIVEALAPAETVKPYVRLGSEAVIGHAS